MRIYGLKTCDTCRKALKALPDAEFLDVRADGVPGEVIEKALAEFGLEQMLDRTESALLSLFPSQKVAA